MQNKNLSNAKKAKNDEFYTQLSDIEKELKHYKSHFKDKIVYCNCDNPTKSEFCRFFRLKFIDYGLKKLICTCITEDKSNGLIYTWDRDINGNGIMDEEEVTVTKLNCNGDFRSQECIELLKEADIVVTNPPFSLFREYVAQLMEYEKKFLIIGNNNAITYKEIFPLIKDNKIWLGISSNKTMEFEVPDGYTFSKEENGKKYGKVPAISWFTNLPNSKRNLKQKLFETYSPEKFPKYDNYDAIEVSKVVNIPKDYDGVMGVPITFLDKYNPEQFEIVGWSRHNDQNMDGGYWQGGKADATINNKEVYRRILIKLKDEDTTKADKD